jgi:hypothetical protein
VVILFSCILERQRQPSGLLGRDHRSAAYD